MKVFFEFEAEFMSTKKYNLNRIHGADGLAVGLIKELTAQGIEVKYDDLWQDCGWIVIINYQGVEMELYFAKYEEDEPWQFTIEVTNLPGIFGKLFGKKDISYIKQVKAVAEVVFRTLEKRAKNINICLSTDTKNSKPSLEGLVW